MTALGGLIVTTGFASAVWLGCRALIAQASRTPAGGACARLFVAERVDQVRVAAVLGYDDELLVTLTADDPTTELTARAWRVVADPSVRTRLARWLDDGTALRVHGSADGAIMLADRVWGGNVACEPALAVD